MNEQSFISTNPSGVTKGFTIKGRRQILQLQKAVKKHKRQIKEHENATEH